MGKKSRQKLVKAKSTEPEYCDTCGELVGYYDPSLPEGEKIVITRECDCARRNRLRIP